MRAYQVGNIRPNVWSAPITGIRKARSQFRRAVRAQVGRGHKVTWWEVGKPKMKYVDGSPWAASVAVAKLAFQGANGQAWRTEDVGPGIHGQGVTLRVLEGHTFDPTPVPPAAALRNPACADIPSIVHECSLVIGKLTNLGWYVARPVEGTSYWSEHSYGTAFDFGGSTVDLARLSGYLVANAKRLGIVQVIFQTRIWEPGKGWFPYTGVPHSTHVHISTADHNGVKPPWA